uniref:CobQ/CobB/MinD/ParA nucleotide binding domain-containing protein n=1 Tax=Magnetococcus massalia (strain MO-1) TaxID=451514 RepID=A0A1S7LJ75_MAGMO|nr:conserved protein of unknown function [Candidatus Magnetococcus massalia]
MSANRPPSLLYFHQKGGTGKSTLAMASSLAAAGAGLPTLLIDGDNQGTSSQWWSQWSQQWPELPMDVRGQRLDTIPAFIQQLSPAWKLCIIDAPPTLNKELLEVMHHVDGLIIPTRPSPADLWALEPLCALLEGDPHLAHLTSRLVINQYDEEPLESITTMLPCQLEQSIAPIAKSTALVEMFMGKPLPTPLTTALLELLSPWVSPS